MSTADDNDKMGALSMMVSVSVFKSRGSLEKSWSSSIAGSQLVAKSWASVSCKTDSLWGIGRQKVLGSEAIRRNRKCQGWGTQDLVTMTISGRGKNGSWSRVSILVASWGSE